MKTEYTTRVDLNLTTNEIDAFQSSINSLVFRPTAGLRWRKIAARPQPYGSGIIEGKIVLEQLWQSDTGEQEWREVLSV